MSETRECLCVSTLVVVLSIVVFMGASAADAVRIALDWTPNTNHTGLFVATELGFFADENLDIEILQPGPTASIALVASGRSEFGVSMQEYVTMARAQDVPVVSIAAVFQHNTSGFAAPSDRGIESPASFENLRYAGWGSDLEAVMIQTVMEAGGADFETVEMVNIGTIDFATAVRRDLADFYWIFYGWQGIHAELEGIAFDYMPLPDLAEVLDYYTPVFMSRESLIAEQPDLVRRFVRAVARGYIYAFSHPIEAAEILLEAVPELERELVIASQCWLAGRSHDDLPIWGWQQLDVWSRFADWAYDNGLIDRAIEPAAAFTNDFLLKEAGE